MVGMDRDCLILGEEKQVVLSVVFFSLSVSKS
jgi:hypothetical protein